MELRNYLAKSHRHTGMASTIGRQLGMAGIGIIWVIKSQSDGLTLGHKELLFPLILLCSSLLLDFLHYLISGIIWKRFHRSHEKNGVSPTADVKTAPWRANVIYAFYYSKIICLFLGYVFILKALIKNLW